jgi:anti-sigma factor (TIGR02949 family)
VACSTLELRLAEYLDGELPGEPARQMDAHIRLCPSCSHRVELERAFREIYVTPLGPDEAPPDLRERMARLVAELEGPATPAARRPGSGRPGRRVAVAAGLAGLLLIGAAAGALVLSWGQRAGAASLERLADASVEQHQKLARGVLPLDIVQVTPKEAERWFDQKLSFNVRLPELNVEHLTFVGGRIAHLEGAEVAALEYRVDQHGVSLFVMPAAQFDRLGLKPEPKFRMLNRNGYDVIVWKSHGVGYALVSEIGGRSCAVCHSPVPALDAALTPPIHDPR